MSLSKANHALCSALRIVTTVPASVCDPISTTYLTYMYRTVHNSTLLQNSEIWNLIPVKDVQIQDIRACKLRLLKVWSGYLGPYLSLKQRLLRLRAITGTGTKKMIQ